MLRTVAYVRILVALIVLMAITLFQLQNAPSAQKIVFTVKLKKNASFARLGFTSLKKILALFV